MPLSEREDLETLSVSDGLWVRSDSARRLLGPVLLKPVEQNIEIFFLIVGTFASVVSGQSGGQLLHAAVTEPIALTIAVLVSA